MSLCNSKQVSLAEAVALARKRIEISLRQKKYHIALSLTNNCPLKCDHCIVSAQFGSFDRSQKVKNLENWVCSGLEIYHDRVSFITFTGGECTLADDAFSNVGAVASKFGINCGLVTSGYFGKTETAARKMLGKYPFIKDITVSFDEFHEKYLPLRFPLNCLRGALDLGLKISARYSGCSDVYIEKLKSIISPEFGDIIEIQPLVSSGRAEGLNVENKRPELALSNCLSDGPHISANGFILPCCSNIVSRDTNKVLGIGHITSISFGDMIKHLDEMPIMAILKAFGWDHIVDNVPAIKNKIPDISSCSGCDQCQKITHNPVLVDEVGDWLRSDESLVTFQLALAYREIARRNIDIVT